MLQEAGRQIDEIYPVWKSVCESNEGQFLKSSERWQRYKPQQMTRVGELEDLLGYDVNNLEHMRLTDCIAIALVDSQNEEIPGSFSREEKAILRKTAMVHDLPEADKGDISYELKTDDDEKRELQLMRLMLKQSIFEGKINEQETEEIISILRDKSTKIGEAFATVESIGYFRTAMVAWKKSKIIEHQESGVSENLIWITNNVLLNQIPKLVEKSKKFVLVKRMLDFFEERIIDAFENMPIEIFDKYEPEFREKNREKFESARNVWNNYLENKQRV